MIDMFGAAMDHSREGRALEYRRQALDCLAIAKNARSDRLRASLIDLALRWARLAEQAKSWRGADHVVEWLPPTRWQPDRSNRGAG